MTEPHERFEIEKQQWDTLIKRIDRGKCVPIIGSQLLTGVEPRREELALSRALEIGYPLVPSSELSMVTEFDRQRFPDHDAALEDFCDLALDEQKACGDSWIGDGGHPLRILAELPFTIFVTTSYFDSVETALRTFRGNCSPIGIACRWGPNPKDRVWIPDELPEASSERPWPTFERPVVFYLHGRVTEPGSLVLSELDHLEFTDSLQPVPDQTRPSLLPDVVKRELAQSTWFFLGYGAADRNLRSLLRALGREVPAPLSAVAMHLQKGEAVAGSEDVADRFLTAYFKKLLDREVDVVLHDVREFLAEIKIAVESRRGLV